MTKCTYSISIITKTVRLIVKMILSFVVIFVKILRDFLTILHTYNAQIIFENINFVLIHFCFEIV